MADDTVSLKYTDERDKAYGLVGMAITLVACDGQDLLANISLDADADGDFEMTHEFFFRGNPRMAAKYLWTANLRHLSIAARMILGNAVCRAYVLRGKRELGEDCRRPIRTVIRDVAVEACSLDDEEARSLFDDSFSYVHRLFSHVGVHSIADNFSEELRRRREMSASEVVELLSRLGVR